MTGTSARAFVDDRPGDGIFRVRRGAFVEPDLFEREMERIFQRCWIYICHDSQLRERGQYVRGSIGRYPVFAIRGLDGGIRCFHDSCPHRGSMLTRGRSGVQPTITCRYHGWRSTPTAGASGCAAAIRVTAGRRWRGSGPISSPSPGSRPIAASFLRLWIRM